MKPIAAPGYQSSEPHDRLCAPAYHRLPARPCTGQRTAPPDPESYSGNAQRFDSSGAWGAAFGSTVLILTNRLRSAMLDAQDRRWAGYPKRGTLLQEAIELLQFGMIGNWKPHA